MAGSRRERIKVFSEERRWKPAGGGGGFLRGTQRFFADEKRKVWWKW
jgi:hypothetical protein